jgi:hypothetical protein
MKTIYLFQKSPRCKATSKRTSKPCGGPCVPAGPSATITELAVEHPKASATEGMSMVVIARARKPSEERCAILSANALEF